MPNKKKKVSHISVHLPPQLKASVERESERAGLSKSEWIRAVLLVATDWMPPMAAFKVKK